MCDFEDDFDSGDFMNEDSFEDSFEDEIMDDLDDDLESGDPDADEFTGKDAFFVGSIVGSAYEEGLEERRRRRLLRKRKTEGDPASE